uniref:V-ATPase subunit E n=1 Tax=candidate division WOR-3 bacterium TaxID=2052148 RepID=A0A7C4CCH7_UNCW3
MGAAALVARIVGEAEARAVRVIDEGNRTAAEIGARARAEAERVRSEMTARAKREAETILERTRSRVRIDLRQARLVARWRAIDRIFALAAERIKHDPRYPERLEQLARQYGTADANVERKGERTRGGLIVRQGSKTLDLSVEQILGQVREEYLPDLARRLFAETT